jgi:signal transduction histidine kinase
MKTESHATPKDVFARQLGNVLDRTKVAGVSEAQIQALIRILSIRIRDGEAGKGLDSLITAVTQEVGADSAVLWICEPYSGWREFRETGNGRTGPTGSAPTGRYLSAQTGPFIGELAARAMSQGHFVIRGASGSRLIEPKIRKWMAEEGIGALLCAALHVSESVAGLITFRATSPSAFASGDEVLWHLLAQPVSIALHWMMLTEQVEEVAVLKERKRVAEEIHDGLTQCFAAIVTRLEIALDSFPQNQNEALSHLRQAQALAREGVTEARRSVWALAPPELRRHDLPGAIKNLVARFGGGTKARVTFASRGRPRPLAPQVESNLLRITQEAFNNALQHGRATRIQIGLVYAPEKVSLLVEDNGRGFDADPRGGDHGFGLFSMRDRAQRVGGSLSVLSSTGAGTRVEVEVPSPKKYPEADLGC